LRIQLNEYYRERKFSLHEFELYWEYKNELWKISKEPGWSKIAVSCWYEDILKDDVNIIRIYDDAHGSGRQIGFVFIGVLDSCHPDADYYIQDAYIEPEYRRQHIMEGVIQSFIDAHSGKYCLFLLDENYPAISFWHRQFDLRGYHECYIEDINDMETYNCHLHAFIE
jgi:predicted acetyltransferase